MSGQNEDDNNVRLSNSYWDRSLSKAIAWILMSAWSTVMLLTKKAAPSDWKFLSSVVW